MIKIIQKISLVTALLLIMNNGEMNVYALNGDVDNNTNNTNVCVNLSYSMRKGSRDVNTNNEVTKLQEALVQMGYMSQDPSGYFGNATYAAVQRFQSANSLISSGYVGTYTRSAIQSVTCNGNYNPNPTPNPTPNPSINLTPASLPSIIYDKDSNGLQFRGINFTDSYNFSGVPFNAVSIVNANISGVSATLSNCGGVFGVVFDGPVYTNYALGACSPYDNKKIVAVSFANSNMTDGQNYYFTIRINQNGSYVDKQYNFTYKKVATNTTCTYSYQNGVYGCYYNYNSNGYNNTDYNSNYNNGYNNSGYNNNGYYNNNNGYNNNSAGYYYNGTYILY